MRTVARGAPADRGGFQRAAFGTPDGDERSHPWGMPNQGRTTVCSIFRRGILNQRAVVQLAEVRSACTTSSATDGSGPARRSPRSRLSSDGVISEYSADFFDGGHYVMKVHRRRRRGTARPSFRNWFRPHYPYVYATFRLAKDVA